MILKTTTLLSVRGNCEGKRGSPAEYFGLRDGAVREHRPPGSPVQHKHLIVILYVSLKYSKYKVLQCRLCAKYLKQSYSKLRLVPLQPEMIVGVEHSSWSVHGVA